MIWKVCAIKDIPTIRWCRHAGADLVGIHAIQSLSSQDKMLFRYTQREARAPYPVLVTKETAADRIADMVGASGARWLQVHAPVEPEELVAVAALVREKTGIALNVIAVLSADDSSLESRAQRMERKCARSWLFLLDSAWRGGTGVTARHGIVEWVMSHLPRERVLLAGGLDPSNVKMLAARFKPGGVDVQSGLELPGKGHRKDPLLVMEFGHALKRCPTALEQTATLISLALTDVHPDDCYMVLRRFRSDYPDSVHFDYSNRSCARALGTHNLDCLVALREIAPCLPYDVHFIGCTPAVVEDVLESYQRANPLVRGVYIGCETACDFGARRLHVFRDVLRVFRASPRLAIHSPSFDTSFLQAQLSQADLTWVDEILVVTHSRAHKLAISSAHDASVLKAVKAVTAHAGRRISLGLDRDMSAEKLRALAPGALGTIVLGGALREAEDPDSLLAEIRNLC
jgi:phosphoribosylanthranilate isomerase